MFIIFYFSTLIDNDLGTNGLLDDSGGIGCQSTRP